MALTKGTFVVWLVIVLHHVDLYRCQKNDTKAKECPKTMTFGWGDAVDQLSRCTVDPNGKPINQ